MDFVAFVGKDIENWGQVAALLKRLEYSRAFIVKDKNSGDFKIPDNAEIVNVNSDRPLLELKEDILNKLRVKLSNEFDVSVSLASGNGKEHMALLSALLNVPVGLRFVVFTKDGIEFIS